MAQMPPSKRVLTALLAALALTAASAAAADPVPLPRPKPGVAQGAVERPIGLKPYFASPPPATPDAITDQKALNYRSQIDRELRALEMRGGPTDRRTSDRILQLRQERSRMDRVIQNYRR